jgi:hypothetical protein
MGVLGISMMIFAFAALIRLQNDFFDRLGNLGYIPKGGDTEREDNDLLVINVYDGDRMRDIMK